jgi:uncharacterized protein YecE (DUF72 family)
VPGDDGDRGPQGRLALRGAIRPDASLATPPPLPALGAGPIPARVGNVRLGTASWTDKSLLESRAFYPPAVNTPEKRLRYYAHHFPLVEVDATYYALPNASHARAWAERTPPDFLFGVKAYAAMTHHPIEPLRLGPDLQGGLSKALRGRRSVYVRDLPDEVLAEIWRRFDAALAPLRSAGKLSYVLFQFPKWFTPTRASATYIESLSARLPGTPIAVEFREARWLADSRRETTLALLRRSGLAYVSVDEPQGTRASVPPLAEATSEELSVVRFHGRNRAAWEKPGASTHERFGYAYTVDELGEWVPSIHRLARQSRTVNVLMNNCYRHYAVQNAKELAVLLARG